MWGGNFYSWSFPNLVFLAPDLVLENRETRINKPLQSYYNSYQLLLASQDVLHPRNPLWFSFSGANLPEVPATHCLITLLV